MKAFLASCRGHAQRFHLRDFAYVQRGSFPAPELLTNSDFASGTTGFTAANATITATDSVLRLSPDGTFSGHPRVGGSVTMSQYVPYVMRSVITNGPVNHPSIGVRLLQSGSALLADGVGAAGYRHCALVPSVTGAGTGYPILINATSGFKSGDYAESVFSSASRCALVDNGPNALLRSEDGNNAVWTKVEATSQTNGTAAPDGTVTDQYIAETTANSAHYITQAVTVASAVADFALSFYLKQANRSWCYVQMTEATGSTAVYAYFNLSTGAIGTTSVGANWSNLRTFVEDFGNGWRRLTIVARKTNAATTVDCFLGAATGDGVGTYVGVTSPVAILWWRASLAQSSVPVRASQTTSAATAGSSQTGGALYLKGLPAGTNGLLLAGDCIEVITPNGSEMKRLRASLDSNAAGLGYAEIEPVIRDSPADGAAVIVQKPMGRFMLDSNSVRWSDKPAGFCDLEFTAVEDIVP